MIHWIQKLGNCVAYYAWEIVGKGVGQNKENEEKMNTRIRALLHDMNQLYELIGAMEIIQAFYLKQHPGANDSVTQEIESQLDHYRNMDFEMMLKRALVNNEGTCSIQGNVSYFLMKPVNPAAKKVLFLNKIHYSNN